MPSWDAIVEFHPSGLPLQVLCRRRLTTCNGRPRLNKTVRMKMKVLLITTTCLAASGLAYFLIQQPIKKRYDEGTKWNQSAPEYVVAKADQQAVSFFNEMHSSWYRMDYHECDSRISDAELAGLKLAGFDPTVSGIADLKSYTTPPYSYIDHERNKHAVVATTIKSVAFPFRGEGRAYYTKDWIYFRPARFRSIEFIDAYETEEDGIHFHRYTSEMPGVQERFPDVTYTPMSAAKQAEQVAPSDGDKSPK